jgi:hypothetical protein
MVEIALLLLAFMGAYFTSELVERRRQANSRMELTQEIKRRHDQRIRSTQNEAEREDAIRVAVASNRVLSEAIADRPPQEDDYERQQAARANEPATAEDLKIVVNDLKTVLRAEGRRTAVSGFVQNALFAALGIIAGVWFQKYPPF